MYRLDISYPGTIIYYHNIWEDIVGFILGGFSLFLSGGQQGTGCTQQTNLAISPRA